MVSIIQCLKFYPPFKITTFRKRKEAEDAEQSLPVSIDPFRDEDVYKPKHQKYKTQFELDFENKWREKFGESYHGGL